MVLVSYILDNSVVFYRLNSAIERDEARRLAGNHALTSTLKAAMVMPGGLKIGPAPMHHLLTWQTSVSIESTVSTSRRSATRRADTV